jgi:hypothetical protein
MAKEEKPVGKPYDQVYLERGNLLTTARALVAGSLRLSTVALAAYGKMQHSR